jgi:hypothetical protein
LKFNNFIKNKEKIRVSEMFIYRYKLLIAVADDFELGALICIRPKTSGRQQTSAEF